MPDALTYCDFCERSQPNTVVVIQTSNGPAICEECVEECWSAIESDRAQGRGELPVRDKREMH